MVQRGTERQEHLLLRAGVADVSFEKDIHAPRVLELRRQGLTLEEIADRLKLTRLDVFRILQRARVIGGR